MLFLAEKGIKRIVYSGKLGALNPKLIPNKMLATGNMSILPNGQVVKWNNLFEKLKHDSVFHGVHATIPSVLQETKAWAVENMHKISFVDPEIGHMAVAANKANIEFSYLHIISDNLSTKFDADLSNERKPDVLNDRMKLCNIIGDAIKELN